MISNVAEWRTQNSGIKYPFKEGAELTAQNGKSMSPSFLADACLFLPFPKTDVVYLASLSISGSFLTGNINHGSTLLGSFSVEYSSLQSTPSIPVMSPAGVLIGRLVPGIGAQDVFRVMGFGTSSFDSTSTEFEDSCLTILPAPALNRIRVSGTDYYGKIYFVEGSGIKITKEDASTLRFDVTGETSDSGCSAITGDSLEKINGIEPDDFGNLFIEPEDTSEPSTQASLKQAIRISGSGNGITISLVG